MPQPKIFMVRHGETEWALSGRHTGITEIELSNHGRSEARALAPFLGAVDLGQVLVSPRKRAGQTCGLAHLALPAKVDEDLREWDYGDYEGRTSVEICKTRKAWNLFQDGCPNGESPNQVSARADRFIGRLRMLKGNTAIFTHGQFGAVLGARWIDLRVWQARHLPLATASVSVLGYDRHHPDTPVIEVWSSTFPEGATMARFETTGAVSTGPVSEKIPSDRANDPSFDGLKVDGP